MNKQIDSLDLQAESEAKSISNSNHDLKIRLKKNNIAPCELVKIESRKRCRHRNGRQIDLIKQKLIELGKTKRKMLSPIQL